MVETIDGVTGEGLAQISAEKPGTVLCLGLDAHAPFWSKTLA